MDEHSRVIILRCHTQIKDEQRKRCEGQAHGLPNEREQMDDEDDHTDEGNLAEEPPHA